MKFRRMRALAALSLIFGAVGASDLLAGRTLPTERPVDIGKPAFAPLGLQGAGNVTLVLQLAGDPVAVVQADKGTKLSAAEKEGVKNNLRVRQDSILSQIERLGGTVVAQYQSAYNGVKVIIAKDKVKGLLALPNVIGVREPQVMSRDNISGVPFIGSPTVWQSLGMHGEGVKVAIIDTGIDYTHANFGGPGTAAAYATAHAREGATASPNLYGPRAPRVKGGIDLVGDSYNASSGAGYQPVPHPDPNPLDCADHGSHVAGTIGGSGVLLNGTGYTGSYDSTTISSNSWIIGPGVAPKADLYAIRVFGCDGSTQMTVDAIDWAVDNDMDVINMSLGSSFGRADDPSAEASTNAVKAGVIVVASAGNSGPARYITGSPGTADGVISVGAMDSHDVYPGRFISVNGGGAIQAMNANGFAFAGGESYTVVVIANDPGTAAAENLGCAVSDYGTLPPNSIVVVDRGVCARVAKAIFAQQAGAAAVLMVNNANSLPPFEGTITSNPDTGELYTVTIPLIGVSLASAAAVRINGASVVIGSAFSIANATFKTMATFSSGGARSGDSFLKPDVSAPGVAVISTQNGSGYLPLTLQGTSMAAPHVAGVAALTVQAHRTWKPEDVRAAIVNTGDRTLVNAYRPSLSGTGVVQPAKSTLTQVVARAVENKFSSTLNFGFNELGAAYSKMKQIVLTNNGSTRASFTASVAKSATTTTSRNHTVTLAPASGRGALGTVVVPARGSMTINVTLGVAPADVGVEATSREVMGLVEFTPVTPADNAGVALRVPYYMVPRVTSNVVTTVSALSTGTNPTANAKITNVGGQVSSIADFYAWGLEGTNTGSGSPAEVRAVGAQAFPVDEVMFFSVSSFNRWSNVASNEFDIYIDVDEDGIDDYVAVAIDAGLLTTGSFSGAMGYYVFSTRTGSGSSYYGESSTDGSTLLLGVTFGQLCGSGPADPCIYDSTTGRIAYKAVGFDLSQGGTYEAPGVAKFNVFSSAITNGDYLSIAPGATVNTTVGINSTEWPATPAKGVMVMVHDNPATAEAQLIRVAPRGGR
ncbi:MAG: S8 family serine peptidase [Usitatibacter sp.]